MRDILTLLAGLVILVLVAALAVPPFVDWRAQRHLVDEAISRASGLTVRTDGALDVRLLPSPRLRIERLRVGEPGPTDASLEGQFVRAEIALTPLLHGEVRFLDSRIGRLEAKLPTGAEGDWRVPRTLVADGALRRPFVFENLTVLQLLVTTFDPGTGRTDQVAAEGVRIETQSLAGPWRLEGQSDGVPFTLVTGALDPGGPTPVKLQVTGEGRPRFGFDGRLLLVPDGPDTLLPQLEGTVRVVAGPESGAPLPAVATAQARMVGRVAELDGIAVEAGDGAATARLSGSGRFALDGRRLTLALEGRRIDLDALGRRDGAATARFGVPIPTDGALKLDSVVLGGEELTGLSLRGSAEGDRLTIESLDVTAPGGTAISASGTLGLGSGEGFSGRVTASARSGDRFAAWLGRLGLGALPAGLLEGRPAELSADVVAAAPVVALSNLRVATGDATVTGALRYTGAEGGARPRLDAQLALQNLDLTAVPGSAGLFEAARAVDLGLILDARNVGYGAGERGGRLAARLRSEGAALAVDRLEIVDLAGANASLSGSLAADGGGRITGRMTARRAAPLLDLAGRAALGPIADLLPPFLREGALDLSVTAERAGRTGALVTRLAGTASGGPLEAEVTAADGLTRAFSATLTTDRAGAWLGRADDPALARPARLQVAGSRDGAGALAVRMGGDVAGVRLATRTPFGLTADEDGIASGEAELTADDAAPLLAGLGFGVAGPVPVGLTARIDREAGLPRLALAGRVAGVATEASLTGPSRAELTGTVSLGRLSLPTLAAALAIPVPASPSGTAGWSTARFGPLPALPFGGTVAVSTATLDLGRGLVGTAARFDLATVTDGFAIRDLEAGLASGRLRGTATLTRQGGLAALIGEGTLVGAALPALAGPPFTAGALAVDLRFGGSGESAAALVAALGGAGTIAIDGLQVAAAEPGAAERAASRAIRADDPLSQPRLAALATEELGRGLFVASESVGGPGSLVGGTLRITPIVATAPGGRWTGAASFDLRSSSLDLRGALAAATLPRGWSGAAPTIGLGWSGPLGRVQRVVDVAPLANGLASVVLTRELERIEVFELDAAERARINARVEMDRARKAAAEQARLRAEAEERARQEAERIRLDNERARQDAERILNIPPPPTDIRPPVQAAPAR